MQMLTPPRPITVYAKPILERMTVIEHSVGTFLFMRIFTSVIENQIGFQGFTRYCPPASVKYAHDSKKTKGANCEAEMNLITLYKITPWTPLRCLALPSRTDSSEVIVDLRARAAEQWRGRAMLKSSPFTEVHAVGFTYEPWTGERLRQSGGIDVRDGKGKLKEQGDKYSDKISVY